MRIFSIAAIGLMATGLFTSAHAGSSEYDVSSGKYTQVYGHYRYAPDCSSLPNPRITVRKEPAHGAIVIKAFRFRIPAGQTCAGQLFTGMGVYYKSARGYRGADEFKIGIASAIWVGGSRMAHESETIRLNVK